MKHVSQARMKSLVYFLVWWSSGGVPALVDGTLVARRCTLALEFFLSHHSCARFDKAFELQPSDMIYLPLKHDHKSLPPGPRFP